jgi:hypothetical protein
MTTSATGHIFVQRTHQPRGVYIYDFNEIAWVNPGKTGLGLKPIRRDDVKGEFLGLLSFEPMTSSGVHQHLGTAISYVLTGGLSDYAGEARAGQAGINFDGSTHDAISYHASLLISRLEGPVVYEKATEHRLHAGAHPGTIVNKHPERPPDINITVRNLLPSATSVAGVMRRMVFDYSLTSDNKRFVELTLLPGAHIPSHVLSSTVDWFVMAGDVRVNGKRAAGNYCVVMEAGTQVEIDSTYGALIFAWADGPTRWIDYSGSDLYGFSAVYGARASV